MAQNSKITPEVFDNLLYLSRLSSNDSDMESIAKKYDVPTEADDTSMISEGLLRRDTIVAGITQSDLKKMSSEYMDGYFRVPKVLGSGV